MIISRTPYRISFFGGGTDYPEWYLKNGGEVISATIDKYCYISCRYLPPFFDHKFRIVYSKNEICNSIHEIKHPSVKEVLKFMKIKAGNLEIFHQGDLPARSGIGSSSAFTVGLMNAIYALQGYKVGKKRLAMESIFIEQNNIKESVGSQDQTAAAFGGMNNIKFYENGRIKVNPLLENKIRAKELSQNLMFYFTGFIRTAEDIAKSVTKNIDLKDNILNQMNMIVTEALGVLNGSGSLDDFGRLLNETWIQKKKLSKFVTNDNIDEIYNIAKNSGALGGKLCGAGGGGFILLYVPPDKQEIVKKKLSKLIYVPIEFDYHGSQIIFSDIQKRYLEEEIYRNINPEITFIDLNYENKNG